MGAVHFVIQNYFYLLQRFLKKQICEGNRIADYFALIPQITRAKKQSEERATLLGVRVDLPC